MVQIEVIDLAQMVAFWLAFTRMFTVLFQIPLFDQLPVPVTVKILASLMITYALYPVVAPEVLQDINIIGLDHFWILTIYEAIVGLLLGFFIKSIMSLFTSAGAMMTHQLGFNASNYFDPTTGARVGPLEQLLSWTLLIVVISSGGLLPMMKGLINSFSTIHLYNWGKMSSSPEYFLELFKSLFISSLLLASPLIFINTVINLVLGIVARMVPQMNVLVVSFAVNIGMGLIVFTATSDEFFQVAFRMYTEQLSDWFILIS